MVAFDMSALVRYITRFTEESFALLIALIFIVEAFKKLVHILDHQAVDLHPLSHRYVNRTCYCQPENGTYANCKFYLSYFFPFALACDWTSWSGDVIMASQSKEREIASK